MCAGRRERGQLNIRYPTSRRLTQIRVYERNGHHATFVLANREQIVLCARLLRRHFDHAADPEVDSRA